MSKKDINKKRCSKCGKERDTKRDFYMSNSSVNSDGRVHICKQCIFKDLKIDKETNLLSSEFLGRMQDVLLELNLPYIHKVWLTITDRTEKPTNATFGIYLRELHLNHKGVDWRDSEFPDQDTTVKDSTEQDKKVESVKSEDKEEIELNTKNEQEVLRLLGYDPFEYEAESDRYNLFNKLIDYLDETTMDDGFRLSSCIEIVRTLNQIDKINSAITKSLSDSSNFSKKAGNITSLVNAKDKMLKSTLSLAQENRISLKHTTSKSTGSGTLSGIIKQLQEYGIEESDTNLFDIETAGGIKQVADLSNESILKQLQLDENDYTSMIHEQKVLINEYKEKADKLEEENRLLRVEIDQMRRMVSS